MLNLTTIKEVMLCKGLNQSDLADKCCVSREAVSRWLACESLPRPGKLKLLADALGLPVAGILLNRQGPTCIADAVIGADLSSSAQDKAALVDMGWRLYELEHFVHDDAIFAPAALSTPSMDPEYLQMAAEHARRSLGLDTSVPLRTADLVALARAAGVRLLPIEWNDDRPGQKHSLRLDWSGHFGCWLIFGTNMRQIDLDAALAHAIGAQYTRSSTTPAEAEEFARAFAQVLCAPGVYRHADPARTVKQTYFAEGKRPPKEFVDTCEHEFGTPVYAAIRRFQAYEGGRNPAFIASLLNVSLSCAVDLSFALH